MTKDERREKMASMYRQGVTLAKIGQHFNLTRERVRQILAKHGITREDGGQHQQAVAKQKAAVSARELSSLLKWGVGVEAARAYRAAGVLAAYRKQRQCAGNRGISWSLTFPQWVSIWELSGHLDRRGRGKGKFCMSRIKDTGGYEVGNVHIQLATENSRDALAKWVGKTKANRGVFHLYPGTHRPWLSKVGKRSLGLFATEAEAVAVRNEFIAENGILTRGRGKGWTLVPSKTRPYYVQACGNSLGYYASEQEAVAVYRAFFEQRAQA